MTVVQDQLKMKNLRHQYSEEFKEVTKPRRPKKTEKKEIETEKPKPIYNDYMAKKAASLEQFTMVVDKKQA